MPDYDMAHHCVEFAKGNQTTEEQCRRNEADARRELEHARVSQEVWSYCKEQIRTDESYVLLYGWSLNEEANGEQRQTDPVGIGSTSAPTSNPGSVTRMRGSKT